MIERQSPVGGETPADPLPFPVEPEAPDAEAPAAEAPAAEAPEPGTPEPDAPEPDVEIVDGFPVLAEVRAVERAAPASLATVQVAAVAATGFVAGAATVALVKRRAARKVVRNGRNSPRRPADLLSIAATRSFLVDVHVIAKPE